MADLKCVVENCTYNKDCLCSKGDIMVGGGMPVIVTAPAARALRRREREESLSSNSPFIKPYHRYRL